MKVVINTDFGGFGLSDQAFERYLTLKGIEFDKFPTKHLNGNDYWVKGTYHPSDDDEKPSDGKYLSHYDVERNDPHLIQAIEELGEKANGQHAKLSVIEIPDGIEYSIEEYDGAEHIAEKHRKWY